VINISRKYLGIDIKQCEFLGKGREGRVYLTPEGYALKIFNNKNSCKSQYNILKKVEGSKYFPKAIEVSDKCMLREYIEGIALDDYLKKQGLSKDIGIKLIELLEEFRRLQFTRIDISSRNVYIESNGDIKVIDPRKSYNKKRDIPGMLLRELEALGALDEFIKVALEVRANLAIKWIKAINKLSRITL
jgi:RIO-like serine/threonine protein kinase